MNTALFKSWHALSAALIVVAFAAWSLAADEWEARRDFVLGSGWVSLGLFLVVMGYVLRKYVHKLGISPEFKMRVEIEKLEKAETRLAELRLLMSSGKITDKAEILKRGRAILKQEGVQWVVKVCLEENMHGGQSLRAMPTGPLGRVATWMHAHLYYGIAAGILVALHGGLATHSGIALLLNGFTLLVIASGMVGIALWAVMPQLLTKAERDLSIEKAHALLESLNQKVDQAYEGVDAATRAVFEDADRGTDDFAQRMQAAMSASPSAAAGERAAQDLMALLGQRRQVREEWKSLLRIKQRMHMWRIVHIPGAVLLMTIVVVHVVSVLWY